MTSREKRAFEDGKNSYGKGEANPHYNDAKLASFWIMGYSQAFRETM